MHARTPIPGAVHLFVPERTVCDYNANVPPLAPVPYDMSLEADGLTTDTP